MDMDKVLATPFFKGVDESYLRDLLEEKIIDVKAGEYVFHQGDIGEGMFIVLNGKLDVILEGDVDNVIATIEVGSFFGEVCLLISGRRTAAIRATEDSQLFYLSAKTYNERVQKNEENALRICHNMTAVLVERLQKAGELIHTLYAKGGSEAKIHEIADYKKKLLSDVLL